MSRRQGGPLMVVGLAVLFLVLPPGAAEEQTLAIRLPLDLDGLVTATMDEGMVTILSEEGDVPRIDLMFDAASARIDVTNFTINEWEGPGRIPEDYINDPSGGTPDDVVPNRLDGVTFLIQDLRPDFFFVVKDGAVAGAEYRTFVEEGRARLDLEPKDTTLTYRDEPKNQDYKERIDAGTFRLSAAAMRHEIRGDFTFFVHGAALTAIADSTYTIDTGSWTETTGLPGQPLVAKRTTSFAKVEVTDAVLSLAAVGGDHDVYGKANHLVIDLDGQMTAGAAAGTVQFENQTVRPAGEGFGSDGHFTITPLWVDDPESKMMVAVLAGSIDSLAVGGMRYEKDPPVAALAAGTVGGILATLGAAYLWKTGILLPLYAKLTKAKVLDQETRNQVHGKVEQDPGCQVKQVAESLHISWTTASYHLRVLRKMGLIVAKRQGRHEHFFVAGSGAAAAHAVVSALQNPTARQIVETVLFNPGIIQKDLCERLAIAPSTASGHLSKLRDIGALREQRDWKKRRYYAGDALHRLPIQLHGLDQLTAAAMPVTEQATVPAQ